MASKKFEVAHAMSVLDDAKEKLSSQEYKEIADGLMLSFEREDKRKKLYLLQYLHLTTYWEHDVDMIGMRSTTEKRLLCITDEIHDQLLSMSSGNGSPLSRAIWNLLAEELARSSAVSVHRCDYEEVWDGHNEKTRCDVFNQIAIQSLTPFCGEQDD